MKFLIDNALSPLVADELRQAGHDALHVRERDRVSATDEEIFTLALRERRVLISSDTDFARILSIHRTDRPSLILFRSSAVHVPRRQASTLVQNLDRIQRPLEDGAIVTITRHSIRVRDLPLA